MNKMTGKASIKFGGNMKNSLISVLIGTGLNLAQAEFLAVNIPIFNKKIRYLFSYPLPKKPF